MTESQAKHTRGDFARMLPGIIVSLLLLVGLLNVVDLEKTAAAIRHMDYGHLPWVVVLFLATITARATAWRTILQEKVTLKRAFWTMNEGFLLNNLLPFRLGEFGRAFLLGKATGLSFWEVLSTIIIERTFDLAMMAALLLVSLPFVIGVSWARQAAFTGGGLVLVGFLVLFFVARNQAWVIATLEKLGTRWPKLLQFGRLKIESGFLGLAALTDAARFARVLGWMLLTWILNVAWNYVLLRAFIPQAEILWAVFALGVASLGVVVPSSPANLGVLEGAYVAALKLFGVDQPTAFAFALTSHAVFFGFTVILGLYALARDGESLANVYAQIRQKQN